MRRTYTKLIPLHNEYNQFIPDGKITCEVTGEMDGGSKVWTRVDKDGNLIIDEQYFCGRMLGKYFFISA